MKASVSVPPDHEPLRNRGAEAPRFETLTPGQKHLLRFGPGNVKAAKQALRNIAVALGIPESRLPA